MAAGNPEAVRPTSLRLPEDLAVLLAAEAKRQGINQTEFIRQAIVLRLALADVQRAAAAGEDIGSGITAILESLGRGR